MSLHGVPSIEVLGSVIHNFAAIGKVQECLSLIYFMNNQRDHELCDSQIIEGFGLNPFSENQSMNVPRPNVICYNLALKSILMNGVSLLNDDTAKSNDSIPKHLEWTFMEMA